MTLAAVWIEQQAGGVPALCFASDSRIGPGPIDGVSKVTLFGRSDIAGVWAGDFAYATLIINHLDAFFTATDAMRRRDVDLWRAFHQAVPTLQRHLLAAVRPLLPSYEVTAGAQAPDASSVVVGGYSLDQGAFVALRVTWIGGPRRWKLWVGQVTPDRIMFLGDDCQRAKKQAKEIRRHRAAPNASGWRMEPLAVVDWTRQSRKAMTVGGDLQLAKTFRHGETRAFAINDPFAGHVSVRATQLSPAAAREVAQRGLAVDLAAWCTAEAVYARR